MDQHNDRVLLQDYLAVLRRQRLLLVSVTVLVVVVALGISLAQTPRYESHTELAIDRVRSSQDVTVEELLAPSIAAVETERLVLTSRPVAELVADRLELQDHRDALEGVRVESVRDTRVVRIIVNDPDPVRAALRADAFAEAYLDVKRDQALDEILAARANLDERAERLRGNIAELDAQIEAADSEEDAQALQIQRDALLAQLGQLIGQAGSLGDASGGITGGGTVLTPAEVPESPVSPRPLRTAALALVLGLLLGTGVAFLRDHFDDVVRDEVDFKRATGGRPILGRIPTFGSDAAQRVITLLEPNSQAAEAYRELSAGTRFLLVTHGGAIGGVEPDAVPTRGRSLMVVSSAAGEGKTATAANLAVAAAKVGLRTILVDADLRRTAIGGRFGIGRSTGLSDVLLSREEPSRHMVDVGVENLRVLPAGTIPPNPAELLASLAMRSVEQELVSDADLVIYDTPAVLAVPDALELGRFVDLAILVGRADVTSRRQLNAGLERLEQVGTDVAGTVLNDVDVTVGAYYYYAYADEGTETRSAPSRWSWRGRRVQRDRSGAEGTNDGIALRPVGLSAKGEDAHGRPQREPSNGLPHSRQSRTLPDGMVGPPPTPAMTEREADHSVAEPEAGDGAAVQPQLMAREAEAAEGDRLFGRSPG